MSTVHPPLPVVNNFVAAADQNSGQNPNQSNPNQNNNDPKAANNASATFAMPSITMPTIDFNPAAFVPINSAVAAPTIDYTTRVVNDWNDNEVYDWFQKRGPKYSDDLEKISGLDGDSLMKAIDGGSLGDFISDQVRAKSVIEDLKNHNKAILEKNKVKSNSSAIAVSSSSASASAIASSSSVSAAASVFAHQPNASLIPGVDNIFGPVWEALKETERAIEESSMAKLSADDQSRLFNSLNNLDYNTRIEDGFRVVYEDEGETIVIDSTIEPKLKALIATTHSFLKIFRTTEKRCLALAKLCVQRFGGGSSVKENVERYQAYVKNLQDKQFKDAPAADPNRKIPYTVSLGALIEVAGLDRHVALLYKYLADRTKLIQSEPNILSAANAQPASNIAINCKLERRWISDQIRTDVSVRIDGSDSDLFVDLFSNPPRLIRDDAISPDYLAGRVLNLDFAVPPKQKVARIQYNSLLTSRVDISSTAFTCIWNDARVTVSFSPLKPSSADQTYNIKLFQEEADILATSLHPSIIRVRAICGAVDKEQAELEKARALLSDVSVPNADPSPKVPTIVMVRDPIEAQPLVNVLGLAEKLGQRDKRWTWERQLHVGIQMSEALSELHLFGIVYGADLCSHKLLITPIGDIKLGDFDASRYLNAPFTPVTPIRYCAPELISQPDLKVIQRPTDKTDVYAFGCVMYSIVTGLEPWHGMTEAEVRNAVLVKKEMPSIPAEAKVDVRLAEVIKRCLAHDPSQRPKFEEIVATLKAILDATRRVVPVPAVESFGWGGGSMSIGSTPLTTHDINALRQRLQPMSDDTVTVAREKFCSSLGMIDPYMIVAKRVEAPSFYVVHRPNGNVALVTCGLWDPNEVQPSSSNAASAANAANGKPDPSNSADFLLGMELIAEANEKELKESGDLSNSWLYQCLLEVACTAKRNITKLRRLLKERQFATMEIMDIKLPFEYLDPTTGRACMLLGIESPTVPKQFMGPNNVPVTVVTARLLTLAQWRDSQEFSVGKKPLAARFNREGTHHISSLILPKVSASENASASASASAIVSADKAPAPNASASVPNVNAAANANAVNANANANSAASANAAAPGIVNTQVVSNPSVIVSVPQASGTPIIIPDVAWTVDRLAARLKMIIERDAAKSDPAKQPAIEAFEGLGDITVYEAPIPTGIIVNSFLNTQAAKIFSDMHNAIRKILTAKSTSPERLKTAAQTVYGTLGNQSQLYGWQHVSEYIRNPKLYIERTKIKPSDPKKLAEHEAAIKAASEEAEKTIRGASQLHEAIDTLQETGHTVVKRLVRRIEWIIAIFRREHTELTVETLLYLIGTDKQWMDDATSFMNSCEYKVAELLSKNPQRFNQFRDFQKKGVQWPHSPDLRREIERAGYTFRPMMIKRDRTVCDTCGAEISGWRSWYVPKCYHDYSKHNAEFRKERFTDAEFSAFDVDHIKKPLVVGKSVFQPILAQIGLVAKSAAVNSAAVANSAGVTNSAAVVTSAVVSSAAVLHNSVVVNSAAAVSSSSSVSAAASVAVPDTVPVVEPVVVVTVPNPNAASVANVSASVNANNAAAAANANANANANASASANANSSAIVKANPPAVVSLAPLVNANNNSVVAVENLAAVDNANNPKSPKQ